MEVNGELHAQATLPSLFEFLSWVRKKAQLYGSGGILSAHGGSVQCNFFLRNVSSLLSVMSRNWEQEVGTWTKAELTGP
jgi:hypothetical protein